MPEDLLVGDVDIATHMTHVSWNSARRPSELGYEADQGEADVSVVALGLEPLPALGVNDEIAVDDEAGTPLDSLELSRHRHSAALPNFTITVRSVQYRRGANRQQIAHLRGVYRSG
jgi:hypothetical protein